MTDIGISPASPTINNDGSIKLPEYGRPGKLVPVHLVSIDKGGQKADATQLFIATKVDRFPGIGAEVQGFYTSESIETIETTYSDIIAKTPITSFVEILFPWSRIKNIRSLVFRQKPLTRNQ